jgi:tetratricopeptide (TPR) repeat protein
LGAAFWLLHPLFVSTTLYIVQREAMLPATFALLGLLLWLRGRNRLQRGQIGRGLACMATGLLGCTGLAVLSKANGILLPALALVVEYALLRPIESIPGFHHASWGCVRAQQLNRQALALLAWPVVAAVAIYLGLEGWRGWHADISGLRPWTLPQRLLTEPRVLVDYLTLLWVPRPFTPGVFNDQVTASRSLFEPASTLFALLALGALGVGAWRVRRRWPVFTLAVFFYLVGQALESSTIALELFFEHRNYLPSLLMFWPLALWLCGIGIRLPAEDPSAAQRLIHTAASARVDRAKAVLATVLLVGLTLMTHARSDLWGNSRDQALMWAMLNPTSPRAQAYAAQTEMATGAPRVAARRLQEALIRAPGDPQLALNLLAARCQAGDLDTATVEIARHALATSRDSGSLLASWFQRAIAQTPNPGCPALNRDAIKQLLEAARANPLLAHNPGRRQDLLSLQGQLDLADGNAASALTWFEQALDQQLRATTAFKQAAMLASAGHPTEALAELDYYQTNRRREAKPGPGMPRLHDWVLRRQRYWDIELAHLRNTLLADQRTQDASNR